jgi:hypothetical protein
MQVIYRSICKEISDAKLLADKNGRTIEEIILTRSESREYLRETVRMRLHQELTTGDNLGMYEGVYIRREGLT